MMSRARFDGLREHAQAALLVHEAAELAGIVDELLAEVASSRVRESLTRADYIALLAAARATIAADGCGEAAPLTFVRWELERHGQLPADGVTAARVLADAAATRALLDGSLPDVVCPPGVGWSCRGCGHAMLTAGIDVQPPESRLCPRCAHPADSSQTGVRLVRMEVGT
ncbi:hypothetical protein [Nonomuraea endophytica]|uniref:Uncharacterized protein n=1 Tax=Nonomuraea endophytica TaxID=714136 RepID=A0A7W8EMI9_9ACTN|nr:hypothetical protein [Nonomuraea endophytica]MBB5085059.1 hypothetical protein [Nonomuraea endophytica]